MHFEFRLVSSNNFYYCRFVKSSKTESVASKL